MKVVSKVGWLREKTCIAKCAWKVAIVGGSSQVASVECDPPIRWPGLAGISQLSQSPQPRP